MPREQTIMSSTAYHPRLAAELWQLRLASSSLPIVQSLLLRRASRAPLDSYCARAGAVFHGARDFGQSVNPGYFCPHANPAAAPPDNSSTPYAAPQAKAE